MPEFLTKEESYQVVGACFEVYREKGCGFTEPIYHECLGREFGLQSIPAISTPRLELEHKGMKLTQVFEPDWLCFGEIIVELKAVIALADEHRAQLKNYLKGHEQKLGLLVNFSHYPKLEWERHLPDDRWTQHAPEPPDLLAR